MDKQQIYSLIKDAIVKDFEKDANIVLPEALLFEDLGFDSLDAFDFFTMVNKKFGLQLEQQVLLSIRSIQDVIDIIHELLQKKK